MNISTNDVVANDILLRNNLIMTAMKRVEAMLRSYAQTHELDFEDLYQDCAELMLRVYARMPADVKSAVAYLYGVARLEMRLIVKRLDKESLHPISLDAPLFEADKPETLADIIPDTRQAQDDARVDHIISTIHEALHECLLHEQVHAQEYYELNSFVPVQTTLKRNIGGTPLVKHRRPHNIRDSVKRVLRNHPRVQGLLQHETAIL